MDTKMKERFGKTKLKTVTDDNGNEKEVAEKVPLMSEEQRKEMMRASGYNTKAKQVTCSFNLDGLCKIINQVITDKTDLDHGD